MKTINWGILGLGKIAHYFATDLLTVPGSKLYAVASRSQTKADQFGNQYNAVKKYGSYEDLAQDPAVDIVYIATPHVRHYSDSLLCILNKKAVLCEKPFAMNATQVEQMIASAKANNVFIMEALWTRILPHFQFVLEEINSGKYGKIKTITADFCFKAPANPQGRLYNKDLGGGALLDVGIYPVFCALALLGKPETIEAQAKIGKTGVDEETTITFTYPDHQKAYLKGGIAQETPTTATIICDKGLIYIESRFHQTDKVKTVLEGVEVNHDFEYQAKGYNYEAAHVAKLLRAGKKESPLMTHDFSKLLIETLDQIRDTIGLDYKVELT